MHWLPKGMLIFYVLVNSVLTLNGQEHVLTIVQPAELMADAGQDITISYIQGVRIGGNPAALHGYGGFTYLWEPSAIFADPTLSNPVVYPEKTTTYTLTVTDGKNCIARDQVTITVSNTGLDDNIIQTTVLLFPNPTDGKLTAILEGFEGPCHINVLDALGQTLVFHPLEILHTAREDFDLSHLPSGIYFFKLTSMSSVEVKSFIIR